MHEKVAQWRCIGPALFNSAMVVALTGHLAFPLVIVFRCPVLSVSVLFLCCYRFWEDGNNCIGSHRRVITHVVRLYKFGSVESSKQAAMRATQPVVTAYGYQRPRLNKFQSESRKSFPIFIIIIIIIYFLTKWTLW